MGHFDGIDQKYNINSAVSRLAKVILNSLDFNTVVQKVVDSIFEELGFLNLRYKIVVLALVDEQKGVLKRISVSRTPEGKMGVAGLSIPFTSVEIPLSAKENFCIQAMDKKFPYTTHYWPDILTPPIPTDEAVLLQQNIGIKTSIVFPLIVSGKTIGVMIFSMEKEEDQITNEERNLLTSFTDLAAIAVQNSRLYSSLERTSQQLAQANAKLQELDKLKDEFVSLASHELRTPMTVIKSYIWILLQGKIGPINEKQKTYLDRTFSSTNRLIDMVNDMLNISRIESGRLVIEAKPMDMEALIKDMVVEMEPRATELGIKLMHNPPPNPLPQVNADFSRIKQVLINLVGNSLKFTPQNGSISIILSVKEGFLLTQVKDTGKGISKDDFEKLFKKFNMLGGNSMVKQSGQGTGLGLYLSKALVELHGGKIWVESEGEGKGSTFSFTLPIVNAN